jgi:hypothetical protein
MSNELLLRNVVNDDLPIFFEYQLDQEANYMAAFTAKDPTNQEAFMAHWRRILTDETTINQTILFNGQVQGVFRVMKRKASQKSPIGLERNIGAKALRLRHLQSF